MGCGWAGLGGTSRWTGRPVYYRPHKMQHFDKRSPTQLQEVGITHIVNVADDVPCFHEALGTFIYQRLDVADFGADKGIARVFHDAAAFVRSALKPAEVSTVEPAVEPTEVPKSDTESTGVPAGVPVSTGAGKVLVHCANGSNRSATVTIALLMLLRTMSLKEAWDHVVAKRPACCPLKDNRAQLLAFEAELYEGRVTMQEGGAKLVPLERGGARRGGAGAGARAGGGGGGAGGDTRAGGGRR